MKTNRHISISLNTLFSFFKKGKRNYVESPKSFHKMHKKKLLASSYTQFCNMGTQKTIGKPVSNPLQELWLVTFPDNILS